MGNIAVITARGGSKRIPRKNIRAFCGKPIIEYSIEAALHAGVFEEVMVSTDDVEIADIAKKAGASVPFLRSEKTSNDFATTSDVLAEVLQEYESRGRSFDMLCCIYPTAPFVTGEKLRAAAQQVKSSHADALLPVVRYSYPPQRALVVRNGCAIYQYPQYALARSQDLEPIYHDCGQFYFCRTEAFLASRSLISGKTVLFIVPDEEVQDIDTESDWRLAELKYINNMRSERTGQEFMTEQRIMSGGLSRYRYARLSFGEAGPCRISRGENGVGMPDAGKAAA